MRLLRRLAYWLRLRSNHADLMDEIAFHREMMERDLTSGGMSADAARDQARRAMGNETIMREESRAIWLWPSLEAMLQDAAYTLRDLRRNPAFTAGVILTLGLGIGANAAMFSLVDRLLLRPPALMRDPDSVNRVYLYRMLDGQESQTGGQYVRYTDLATWSTAFSQTAAFTEHSLAMGVGTATRLRNVAIVSASFFDFFDAPPILGRYFTTSEDSPPRPTPLVVLSEALWRTEFGGRRDVLGATIHIDAVVYTVIGVAPDAFVGLWPYRPPAAFVPVTMYAASRNHPDWATTYNTAIGLEMIVRRKPNVTTTEASADLTSAFRRSYQAQVDANPGSDPISLRRPRAVAGSVLAERGPEPSGVTRAAKWLSGVTVIVLLIACANVANLLLARTARRRREIALRIALGVSQARLFGQLLTEGIVLAILGGVAGVLIAVWGSALLRVVFLPRTEATSVLTDSRTLLFSGVIALGVGVLTGLAPIVLVRRADLTSNLKAGARDGTHRRTPLRSALLVLQSALSVVLLLGAGAFVLSLRHVRDVRLGFDADSVLLVELNMRDARLDSVAMVKLRLRLLQSAQGLPGVSHASLQESIPFSGMSSRPIYVAGIDSTAKLGRFHFNTVSSDYFATMGTRIVRGRGFALTDVERSQPVVVVGSSMAAVLWPGQDPIGRCIKVWADSMPCRSVVGVAEDIHSQSIEAESKLYFYYLPAAQWRPDDGGLFVRASGSAAALVEAARKQLQREMPGTSFVTVKRLSDIVDGKVRPWTVGATVFTAFGALALVLAAVGLYSVIAYDVAQRRHELGVRMALGARRLMVVRLVVAQGVRFALAGVAIGGGAALVAGKWVGPMLFEQSPSDPAVFGAVIAILLVVAVVSSWLPALRAASVDPRTALQSD
ncbi:MAG TPA: ADOP family duplicated permease [Gemmatimonadaceae bacterium]